MILHLFVVCIRVFLCKRAAFLCDPRARSLDRCILSRKHFHFNHFVKSSNNSSFVPAVEIRLFSEPKTLRQITLTLRPGCRPHSVLHQNSHHRYQRSLYRRSPQQFVTLAVPGSKLRVATCCSCLFCSLFAP